MKKRRFRRDLLSCWALASILLWLGSHWFWAGRASERARVLAAQERREESLAVMAGPLRYFPFHPFFWEKVALEKGYLFYFSPLSRLPPISELKALAQALPKRENYWWVAKVYERCWELKHQKQDLLAALRAAQKSVQLSPYFARGRIEVARLALAEEQVEKRGLFLAQKALAMPFPKETEREAQALREAIASFK